jgi:hypothetical protein
MFTLAAFLIAQSVGVAVGLGESSFPTCIRVQASAPYGNAGYDHIVTLDNGCDKPAACLVSTDVNPDAIAVDLAPGETKSVLTFRGSPARTFRAHVSCRLEE